MSGSQLADVFGVVWDYSNSSTALTRLNRQSDPSGFVTVDVLTEPVAAVGTDFGSSPFDSHAPWSGMEEYNIVNNAVGPKYGETGFSRTDNDTMVYIPEFYYNVKDDSANSKRYFYISDRKTMDLKSIRVPADMSGGIIRLPAITPSLVQLRT